MDLSMMGICYPFLQMFKLAGRMCSLKYFVLNFFVSVIYMLLMNSLSLYMFITVCS